MEKHELRAKAKKLGINGWASKSSRDLVLEIRENQPAPKEKKEKKAKKLTLSADVNKDGVVDEKDLSAVHKEYAKAKAKSKAKPKSKKKPVAKKKK